MREGEPLGRPPHGVSMIIMDHGQPEDVNTGFKTIQHACRCWSQNHIYPSQAQLEVARSRLHVLSAELL